MPRRGEILEATNHDGHSYRLSPFTPNQWSGRRNTINGGASISDRRRRRRGIAEGEERGELNINFSIPNPIHQCTSCALCCLVAVRRGVWLRSCFEAEIHLKPLHTSILDMYKVFETLVCCLKGIWLHPYTITRAKFS
jgi:hypothetical protein